MNNSESEEDHSIPRQLPEQHAGGVAGSIATTQNHSTHERNTGSSGPSSVKARPPPFRLNTPPRPTGRSSLNPFNNNASGSSQGFVGSHPTSTEARSPVPHVMSPSNSPDSESSPFRTSPTSTPPQQSAPSLPSESSGGFFGAASSQQPSSSGASSSKPLRNPWHTLAAMSGAPTPGMEMPSSSLRSSVLGDPFEQLNLGSTWSHRNLSQSGSEPPPPSRSPAGDGNGQPGTPSGPVSAGGLGNMSSFDPRRTSFPGLRSPPMSLGRRPSAPNGGSPSGASTASPSSPSSSSSSNVKPLAADALNGVIGDGARSLVLDLRPPSSYDASHIQGACSISVPSTLLRRPGFALPKLTQMLSQSSQSAISQWPNKTDIVIVDQDSSSLADSNLIQALATKFVSAGYSGKIWFVQGGHAAVAASSQHPDLVSSDSDKAEGEDMQPEPSPTSGDKVPPLGLGRLSRLAFTQGSTTSPFGKLPATTAAKVHANPFEIDKTLMGQATAGGPQRIRPTESSRSRLQPANPFFDNIRQNLELSHGGITERIPLALSPSIVERADELPEFLRDLVQMPEKDSMDLLADQFYRIELGEQQRLQTVMQTLSRNDGCEPDATTTARSADEVEQFMARDCDKNYYPFSITAGVERGTKNRYKNIWPYDFSRVRLGTPAEDESDYINASFVQPRTTSRRYIATQGPLDATYRDFWTLVWEQNVHVIVMLTKQFEGGLIKCGNYWSEQTYGHLRLQLVSESGGQDVVDQSRVSGFDFGSHVPEESPAPAGNIKRVFHLWHNEDGPRKVTQIQCTTWPDFDVPDSPEVLLNLKKDVDGAIEEMCEGVSDECNLPPILVHCSAGVGRTGSYILVDAIAEALKREIIDPERQSPSADGKRNGVSESAKSVSFADSCSTGSDSSPRSSESPVSSMDMDKQSKSGSTDMDQDETDFSSLFLPSETASRHSSPSTKSSPDIEQPVPVTQSHQPHRQPKSISKMKEPILNVLRGMRVQRMSLVQSLRQYLFVHRAIISYYLSCLDDEGVQKARGEAKKAHAETQAHEAKKAQDGRGKARDGKKQHQDSATEARIGREAEANTQSLNAAMSGFPSSNRRESQNEPVSTDSGSSSGRSSNSADANNSSQGRSGSSESSANHGSSGSSLGLSRSLGGMTTSTAATSLPATDDESTFKRKPSSTDLAEADARLRSSLRAHHGSESDSSSGLSKRPSFKKRRGSGGERMPVRPPKGQSTTTGPDNDSAII